MAPVSVRIVTLLALALSSCVGGSDPGEIGSSESALQGSDLDSCVGDALQAFLVCSEEACGATAHRASDKCVEACRGQAEDILRACLAGDVEPMVTPMQLEVRKYREPEQRIDVHPGPLEEIHPDW